MKITCPHCGVVGSSHGSMPGEKVRCPQCDKAFKIMLQKIACPHCGVIGSAADSMVGMKLRCPRCEKVFLLMQDRLIGPSVSAIEIAGEESMSAVESGGVVSSAGGEKTFLEPITEMELEVAPEPEAEPEIEVAPEPEPELKIVHEAEPVLPVEETKGEDQEGEGLESTAMPAHVCDGCGESFHPEFMQEIDSKFYCGVCQLRSAALDAKEKAPRFGGGQLRGTLAALLLLGLLVLLVLVLKKLGII